MITVKHDVKCAGLALARLISRDSKLQAPGFDAARVAKSYETESDCKVFVTVVSAVARCLSEKLDDRPTATQFRALLGVRNASVDLSALCSLAAKT